MAAKAPNVTRHGSARDLSNAVDGAFVASGEGEYSRRSASGQKREHAARGRPARVARGGAREFLARTEKQIAKLRGAISLEANRDRRAKLEKDFALKVGLAGRLSKEIGDQHSNKCWNWTEIETLPGDGERPEADWL